MNRAWTAVEKPERQMSDNNRTSGIDPRLLEIIVCPLSKTVLQYDSKAQELISRSAKLAFPIRDGIPILLPEEARRIDCE